jgi:phage gp16-like protein
MSDIRRGKDLKIIHICKKDLGLDDETYRDMLHSLTGKTSAKDMDYKERWQVLCEMQRLLGRDNRLKAARKHPGRPANGIPGKDALIGKIEALLAEAKLPWAYVNGMAKKMFSIDVIQWCDPDQLWRIVAALEYNKNRKAEKTKTTKAAAGGGAS